MEYYPDLPNEDSEDDDVFFARIFEEDNDYKLNKFNKPKIYKRKKKTRTKRFYTEEELKKYKQRELQQIIKFNKLSYYGGKETKKRFIEILMKQPIKIPDNFQEAKTKVKNVQEEKILRIERFNKVKKEIEEMVANKIIQTEEKYKKIFETENNKYLISNFGFMKIINKNNNNEKIKKMKHRFNITEGRANKNLLQGKSGKYITDKFLTKRKKNEETYYIDGNKDNNNVNNLLIVPFGYNAIIKESRRKIEKGKKGYIQKIKNKYRFRYYVSRNFFQTTFNTKEEAEAAQKEYIEKIDEIENPFNKLTVFYLSFHGKKEVKKAEEYVN